MQSQIPTLESVGNGFDARSRSTLSDIAETMTSRASREFHNFVADIEALITKTTSLSGQELEDAKEQLNERIASARTYLDDVSESLVQRARRSAAVTNNYVHDQPWAAVGIGAAVGLVVGLALGNRK